MDSYEVNMKRAMDLAEEISTLVFTDLRKDSLDDGALLLATVWAALAIGLKLNLHPEIIKLVIHYATESVLEDMPLEHETIH
jgi:hypothetical protein|tara:strand:+ start:299 stop:544 length:246 start_codon:yes stop_codon:yes gene_type:complete